jgi:hypothetical protein
VTDVIKEFQDYSEGELLDERKETISTAAAAECKALTNVNKSIKYMSQNLVMQNYQLQV